MDLCAILVSQNFKKENISIGEIKMIYVDYSVKVKIPSGIGQRGNNTCGLFDGIDRKRRPDPLRVIKGCVTHLESEEV